MAFDFKKEYREFYLPKNQPEIVTVPRASYIAVRGSGDPNEAGGAERTAGSFFEPSAVENCPAARRKQ